MNRKGLTLVELLGATVIFSLAIGLIASVIVLINKATESINIESQVNREGMYVVRVLEEAMTDFDAKDYVSCGTNCISLESDFSYDFDENINDFVVTIYDPVHTLEINLTSDPSLYIDGELYTFNGVTLLNTSSIEVTTTADTVRIVITLVLESSNGKSYQFTANHFFTIQPIPA